MPLDQTAKTQVDPVAGQRMVVELKAIKDSIAPSTGNLTPKERQDFGSINEKNKLIVGKTMDYNIQLPELRSPDVDWERFNASWQTRTFFKTVENLCHTLLEMCEDGRILHDYDLYQMMRTDYKYTKYKAESTTAAGGFTTKYEELKQFFPNSGGSNDDDNEADNPTPIDEQK